MLPRTNAPSNLFHLIGTPNLVFGPVQDCSQISTGTGICDDKSFWLGVHNSSTTKIPYVATGNTVRAASTQVYPSTAEEEHSTTTSKLGQAPHHLEKCAQDKTEDQMNNTLFTALSAKIEWLLRRCRYTELASLLFDREKEIFPLIHAPKPSAGKTVDSEDRIVDILLSGAIAYSVVGLLPKTYEWCRNVLNRSSVTLNQVSGKYRRYKSVALALVGYTALLENDLMKSLHFLTLSVCSTMEEWQAVWKTVRLQQGQVDCLFILIISTYEAFQSLNILTFFLGQQAFVVDIIDAYSRHWKSMEQKDFLAGEVTFLDVLKETVLQRWHVFETYWKPEWTTMGRLYMESHRLWRLKNFNRCKVLLTQWTDRWLSFIDNWPCFGESTCAEGYLLSILAMHVLRLLGRICQMEAKTQEAAVYFTRALRLQADLFAEDNLIRVQTMTELLSCLFI